MNSSTHLLRRSGPDLEKLVMPSGKINRALYVDDEIFNLEMSRIFASNWVFLVHEAELPKAHDYKVVSIGGRSTIVSRQPDGSFTAVLNRCTHRASAVCHQESGNAQTFRCPYHGWTFRNDGTLTVVPFDDGYESAWDKAAHDLVHFSRVEIYQGYVFGSLQAPTQSLQEWLGGSKELIDWCAQVDNARKIRIVKGSTLVAHANWKYVYDNACDAYHVPFVHASTAIMNVRRGYGTGKTLSHFKGDNTAIETWALGNGHKLLDQRAELGSPWERARPIPGRETLSTSLQERVGDEEALKLLDLTGRSGINLAVFPNLGVLGHGSFYVIEPVSPHLTNIRFYVMLLEDGPEEVNILRLRFEEDFNNVGTRDDIEIMERAHQGLVSIPEVEWIDLSKGLNTTREQALEDGRIRAHGNDDTSIRESYVTWLDLMTRKTDAKGEN